jgi:tRNA nucleotidyltransferase (CCA-adding enzyme)
MPAPMSAPMSAPMQIYLVGGAVRDQLLGLPVQDKDWLVVGASPQAMQEQGFLPVGKDFPVFLHPKTHEEYALARTERKTAPGYQGFAFHAAPDVTLEQDLRRRDLTINAMARDQDGQLIDLFGGQHDLAAGVLRHVSPSFAEDPVRILRLARFAARFAGFTVAPETQVLMCEMVRAGEVDALVAERVWQELAHGLMERHPVRMIEVLRDCGALAQLMPELPGADDNLWQALERVAQRPLGLPCRFAVMTHKIETTAVLEALCKRMKVPAECRDLAILLQREWQTLTQECALIPALSPALSPASEAEQMVAMFQRCDAWRKPERFDMMLQAADSAVSIADVSAQCRRLRIALQAAQKVQGGEIAKQFPSQAQLIAPAIYAARVLAVESCLISVVAEVAERVD